MFDATFWHDMAGEFEKLPQTLFVHWQYTSGLPGRYNYTISGASQLLEAEFELLARRAGAAIDPGGAGDSLGVWLDVLRKHEKDPRNQGDPFGPEILEDGTSVRYQLGKIPEAAEASASRCLRLEMLQTEAERQSKSAGTRPEQPDLEVASSPRVSGLTHVGRRAAVDAFIVKLADAGRKITKKDIWTVAGYTDRTEFERFQRGDKLTTQSATRNFNRVLSMKPKEFIRALEEKTAK